MFKPTRAIAITIMCIFCIAAKSYAEPTLTQYTRTNIIAYDFHSDILNRDFVIEIKQPVGAGNPANMDITFPVVYSHDALMMMPHMAIGNQLQQLDGKLPGMYTVSINYPYDASPLNQAIWRFADLTADSAMVPGVPFPLGGGADAFLDFINDELKPFVSSTFQIDESEEYFYGHSLGGLFGLHTLFTRTDTFDKYLISSPSIWWNDKSIVQTATDFIATNYDLDKRVHMVVGGEETPDVDDGEEGIDMVQDMKAMYGLLKYRFFPSLKISKKVYKGEGHVSVVIPSYYYGMRTLMEDPTHLYHYKPMKKFEKHMKKHMEHIRQLMSEKHGW